MDINSVAVVLSLMNLYHAVKGYSYSPHTATVAWFFMVLGFGLATLLGGDNFITITLKLMGISLVTLVWGHYLYYQFKYIQSN